MSIRDVINGRLKSVVRTVLDAEIRIGRISSGAFVQISGLPAEKRPAEIVAACVLDERESPVFSSPDEAVKLLAWQDFEALLEACIEVNGLKREEGAAAAAERKSAGEPAAGHDAVRGRKARVGSGADGFAGS